MKLHRIAYLRGGAALWIISIQFYIVQLIVASRWTRPNFSLASNAISDLGNTHCGYYGTRLVCSPSHVLMNISFALLGLTMIAGSALLYRAISPRRAATIGFLMLAGSGVGSILVALYPENVASAPHITGASLSFIGGNLAIVLLSLGWRRLPRSLRAYGVGSGLAGLAASVLLVSGTYAGLGFGGMERIAAYPQSLWMIVIGSYVLCESVKPDRG